MKSTSIVHNLIPPDLKFEAGPYAWEVSTFSTMTVVLVRDNNNYKSIFPSFQRWVVRGHPTLEDKERFSMLIKNCAFQPLNFQIILFYQYLVDYANSETSPFIDQDLIFLIEISKYQVGINNAVFDFEFFLKYKVFCEFFQSRNIQSDRM